MNKSRCYIITLLLCLTCNVLGSLQCFCNKDTDGDADPYYEEKLATIQKSNDDILEQNDILEQMKKEGKEANESYEQFKKDFEESGKKFAKEQAAEALKTEEDRQAKFKKDREEWKKLCEDELASGVANRNKVKRGEVRGDIKLCTLLVGDITITTVNRFRREVNEFKEELANSNANRLTSEQKEDLTDLLYNIDIESRELEEKKKNLIYFVSHPDPDIPFANSAMLQLTEKLLAELRQQRVDLAQMVSKKGDDISNYITLSQPQAPSETVEDNQLNKALFLAISDPSDAKDLVTNLEQKMQQMIAHHAPVPTTTVTLKISEPIKKQAQALATEAYELRRILGSREFDIKDAYFGESMNDYIDRSTEEGVTKLKLIQAALDQLAVFEGLFEARFHVVGYSPDIVSPPRITQSYINDLVNALVDQLVPGSELVKGKPTPTTAEAWADLALSEGLDTLAKTSTIERFKEAPGVGLLIKPIGSTRYNMLKERIIEVYKKRRQRT